MHQGRAQLQVLLKVRLLPAMVQPDEMAESNPEGVHGRIFRDMAGMVIGIQRAVLSEETEKAADITPERTVPVPGVMLPVTADTHRKSLQKRTECPYGPLLCW